MQYVLGADPGKHGAIVLIKTTANRNAIKESDVIMIPTKVSEGKVNTSAIIKGLQPYIRDVVMAVQEKVSAMFGWGAGSIFEFGDANGVLRGTMETMMTLSNNPDPYVHVVPPKTWQHAAWKDTDIISDPVIDKITGKPKLLKSGKAQVKVDTKATSMNAAHRLFPTVSFVMPRCKLEHDGCIDAALIAYYALCKWQA